MLFGQKSTAVNGIQYTDGIVGSTIRNGYAQVKDDGAALVYNSGVPYYQNNTKASLTYDTLLNNFEVIFDPARGGGRAKLALASRPVITHFNKLSGFIDNSLKF